jgi:hypothetical protein
VHVGHDVGAGHHQEFVASFEGRPTEVVGAEVAQLQVGAHGAVPHDDTFTHGGQVRSGHGVKGAGAESFYRWVTSLY